LPPTTAIADQGQAVALQVVPQTPVDVVALVDQGLVEIETDQISRATMIERLCLAFTGPAVEIKAGTGYRYISHETCTRRLNWATGFNWSSTIDNVWFREDGAVRAKAGAASPTVMIVQVTITIPGLGSHSEIGVQAIQPGSGEDAAYKSAASDALKRAAMRFNVAIGLYGDDVEGVVAASEETVPAATPAPKPKSAPAPATTPAAPGQLEFAAVKAGIVQAQGIIGAETIQTEMKRRFGVDVSSKMTDAQWRELYAWTKVQVDAHNKQKAA
jgi:Rad52/22 family double-strand break repair protein